MKQQSLLLLVSMVVLCAFGPIKKARLTVILYHNQNPGFTISIDTLWREREIDLSASPIGVFFVSKNFRMPYYVPTEGIFRNAAKDRECDMKIYPAIVKCYEYDKSKRVVRMTVNGSGTTNEFRYLYNEKNQMIEIADHSGKYTFEYKANGNIAALKMSDGVIFKKLVFNYK